MEIEKKLELLFKKYKKQISIKELIKVLELKKEELDYLLNILFELEKKGIIIYDDIAEKYMSIPEKFIYQLGVATKGKSNNYYIKLSDGSMVIFKNNKNLKPGDTIYYLKEKTEHPKRYTGIIKRIVSKIDTNYNNNYITKGILQNEGNHFYIKIDNKNIYIDKNSLKGAFSGDEVSINVKDNIGYVIDILQKQKNNHVFKAIKTKEGIYWTPIAGSFGKFFLPNNNFKEGDLIIASSNNYNLELIKKIETYDSSLKTNINALINEAGFYDEFPEEVLNQAQKIEDFNKEEFNNRKDLRYLKTITIDPKNAKDLDDAISIEYDDDKYILYVHLANPSYYIKLNSPLFKEALKRGFSIYPCNSVIPMLPKELSSNYCSLNESGDKLAITFKAEINKKGNIEMIDIFKSIIKNDKQMNYDDVDKFLKDKSNIEYQPYTDILFKMKELAEILDKKKEERGAINLNIKEKTFILDDNNTPIIIEETSQGMAQKIIENFMLLANESIAVYAYNLGLPYYYRNHEKPTMQKKINLKNNLKNKGYIYDKLKNIDSPRILQKFINQIINGKSKEEKDILYNLILKAMPRAFYSGNNIGHYGLALDCYGTFTSPARKFTDLINQMIIGDFLDNGYTKKQEIYKELIDNTSEYISEKQKAADILEQDINNLILNYYASKYLNIEVNAKIIFIGPNEIYIKDENNLTGIIPINRKIIVKKDKLLYNNKEYRKGDTIKVTLINTNNEELIYKITEQKVLTKKRKKN